MIESELITLGILFLFAVIGGVIAERFRQPAVIGLLLIGAIIGPNALNFVQDQNMIEMMTEFGAILDPIADRILILPIAVYSLYYSEKWLLLVLLLTEIISGGISLFYREKTKDAKSNIFGKTRMVMLSFVFVAILVFWPTPPSLFFIDVIWVSLIFSYLSIFVRVIDLVKKGYIKNKIINKKFKI